MCSSGRHRAPEVEGVALVRDGVEEDAARLQFAQVGLDRADRVLAVLEEVVGDDEVLRLSGAIVASGSPSSTTSTSVRSQSASSGYSRAQVVDRHPVDVADMCVGGRRQRLVQGADLQALAEQEAGGELGAGVEVRTAAAESRVGRLRRRLAACRGVLIAVQATCRSAGAAAGR